MEKSITDRYWIKDNNSWFSSEELLLAEEFRVAPEIIKLLEKRGISGKNALRKYLYPTLQDLSDPFTMKDMDKACRIIHEGIINNSDFIIWGDYDVDGVTSTCLLIRFFRGIGIYPAWYIPDRFKDGYGLNSRVLEKLIQKCEKENPVLITVDCGISNVEEIRRAQDLGCRVIVTDHHEPGKEVVTADAILNVKQSGCSFPDKEMAGVGISFYLAIGLRMHLSQSGFFVNGNYPNLKSLTELVAIGTIADMVPLKNCNRVLVRAGFEILNTTPSIGVAALLQESDIAPGNITSDDIAFQVAPKINAAGRLNSAALAVELLLTDEKNQAIKMAKKLTVLNTKRKKLCNECLESVLTNTIMYQSTHNCIVLNLDHNLGILGIVASQLVLKKRVPAILVTEVIDENMGKVLKGSCRSIQNVNIHKVLSDCSHLLLGFGGHEMAAGVTLYASNLKAFSEAVSENIAMQLEACKNVKEEVIDIVQDVEKTLSGEFIRQLQLLEPFGEANKRPIFINYGIILNNIRRIGKSEEHLILEKRGRFENNKCIAFNLGYLENVVKQRPDFHLVYTVMISRFKQSVSWQANVIDLI